MAGGSQGSRPLLAGAERVAKYREAAEQAAREAGADDETARRVGEAAQRAVVQQAVQAQVPDRPAEGVAGLADLAPELVHPEPVAQAQAAPADAGAGPGAAPPDAEQRPVRRDAPAQGGGEWAATVAATLRDPAPPARWGWRGRLVRGSGGLLKLRPTPEEQAHRDAITTIRQATWRRAVNVLVANPKGGVGKTPTSLVLAGVLGHVRGGSVGVWEAAESAGTLSRRAEGQPVQGLAELLRGAAGIRSAGHLGGYAAPQTSHADVIGSIGSRPVLTAADVVTTRRVLDTYYRITVTDTGNNPGHEAFLAALHTADALVLPCLVSIDALAGAEEALEVVRGAGGRVSGEGGLASRAVVVLGHDGGPEDERVSAALRQRLDELGVHAVVEVPFDPVVRRGGEISLAGLSEESTRAWTAVAAAVVGALRSAPTDVDLVAEFARAGSRPGSPAAPVVDVR
ncbi:MinD-like ATPase involved in chromosome partitioning or flagellar assembly [Kineococcus xinjiangensis]|uniref:MinD-like ATPase involved in chromosome partitioning or flagellar assembly n=1 Tax=Kineococcus xinjiangensis TaxID=512762 RepID=A0A2S6IVC1_9ACTN|nr:hypothetical protein [Kineococcus xinjiangensis]PPK98186.1 MinD-like ATPase involved in chromosome partitioning or flagellar assembly [Kineococcus xinjiangensis]